MTALAPEITWVTAAPLWGAASKSPSVMRRPTILGYGSDNFMDLLLAQLKKQPEGIASAVATGGSRSYRERLPGEPYDAAPTISYLKLYQPVHGWFYLVAGSLVCRLPGLPDHAIDVAAGEKVSFVLRRLDAQKNELALVSDDNGGKTWQAPSQLDAVADGEEALPLFPVGFLDANGRRKMFAGVIPTASQDALQSVAVSATSVDPNAPPSAGDAFEDVKGRVVNAITLLQNSPPNDPQQIIETSTFVLMDLADFLSFYIPKAWTAIENDGTASGSTGALVTLLRATTVAGKSIAAWLPSILASVTTPPATPFNIDLTTLSSSFPSTLEAALQAALNEATTGVALTVVDDPSVSNTLYVTRMVYQAPNCVPLRTDVVSNPSEPFALSPYFDTDAPQRPIRIALPFDASVKGLRQFRKSVKLVLSSALQQKVSGIGKVTTDISGPSFDCGAMILSIPIITICAMIILFIFISLLNIVFFWMPFVKICLPKINVEP